MKGTIKLINPLKISNKTVKKLSYDTNEITGQMFTEADALKGRSNPKAATGKVALSAEMDYSFHLYLGYMAVLAVNPEYDVMDLERGKGYDQARIMQVGRRFFTPELEEASEQSNLENSSDGMPENSTPAPESLQSEG